MKGDASVFFYVVLSCHTQRGLEKNRPRTSTEMSNVSELILYWQTADDLNRESKSESFLCYSQKHIEEVSVRLNE
jgi:hypothetical protein